jgi:hypothetical protein
MKVVALGRQEGKTTKMLQWLREAPEGEHRVLVCVSDREAMRLLRENVGPDSSLESWQFVGPDEVDPDGWQGVLMGRGGTVVLGIDNIDLIVSHWLHWPVGAISVTTQQGD